MLNDIKDNTVVNDMLAKIESEKNIGLASILQTAMNLLMVAERNVALQNNPNNKANGYFERELGTSIGSIQLKVPRDRNSEFRSEILPKPYQRDAEDRENILRSLLVNSYSPNSIKQTFGELGLHYNPKELCQIKQEYIELYNEWSNRQLPQDAIGLFIDVYHSEAKLENKVCKTALYVIVGIDFNGNKDLFGLYIYQGNETKGFWLSTLNNIIERGLKRPLIVVSDDFPGLKEAIQALFPGVMHQLCFIHMQRNVRRNMDVEDSKQFNTTLGQIRAINDIDSCKTRFTELCENYKKTYPTFIRSLLEDTDNYFAFKYLPQDVQKHFYTTNIVESVNSGLEKLRQRMGGFFQSKDALYINVFITIKSLRDRKWCNGVPMIKKNLFKLRQLFAQKYGEAPID